MLFNLRHQCLCALATLLLVACGGESLVDNRQNPDPVVVDVPLAFIKRHVLLDEDQQALQLDLFRPEQFIPGAALYIKARASTSATEINITDRAFAVEGQAEAPLYDVKDLSVSYDGNRLLFAMRAPELEDVDDDEQPSWNLWEYTRDTDQLRRIISDDRIAEGGQDVSPTYLADGRILFSSTRQQANQAILLDEGKPQYQSLEESMGGPAFVLHVMNADGTDIQQISFNQSHDLDPVLLSDGRILFSRWDRAGSDKGMHLYSMQADGSQLAFMYGRHSHTQAPRPQRVHFVKGQLMPDGNLLAQLLPANGPLLHSEFVAIDPLQFTELELPSFAAGSNAQTNPLFANLSVDGSISPGGRFAGAYPLWDGSQRMLVAWSQCRVYDPTQAADDPERKILPCSEELLATADIEEAPLLFGLWIFDAAQNTQRVVSVAQEGQAYTEVVALQARPYPADPQTGLSDTELAAEQMASVHIRSVYDFGGEDLSGAGIENLRDPMQYSANQRPARFLRVVKAVSIPDDDTLDFDPVAFGRSRAQSLREIIGYVPVEPDGSVKFAVPANVPLAFSVLDANGRRISARHENWLHLRAGEQMQCNGCHTQQSTVAHGRPEAEAMSINAGAVTTGQAFLNTNPALFADAGETMAEVATRINGLSYPKPDIEFSDIWSDPTLRTPDTAFAYRYVDLQGAIPISQNCALQWQVNCRIVTNYPQHIQPIFDQTRQLLAADNSVVEERTCSSCHSMFAADDSLKVPDAQLDLRNVPSNEDADMLMSYRELLFNDNEQVLEDGAIQDRLVPALDANGNQVFETDEDGELILDGAGEPIPVFENVTVNASMSTNGALSSGRFFTVFADGGVHAHWLTAAELKLLAEWLDIGAQYYNNPFDAPLN